MTISEQELMALLRFHLGEARAALDTMQGDVKRAGPNASLEELEPFCWRVGAIRASLDRVCEIIRPLWGGTPSRASMIDRALTALASDAGENGKAATRAE